MGVRPGVFIMVVWWLLRKLEGPAVEGCIITAAAGVVVVVASMGCNGVLVAVRILLGASTVAAAVVAPL